MLYQVYVIGVRFLSKPFYNYFTRLPNDSRLKENITAFSIDWYCRLNQIELKYTKQRYHYGYLRESVMTQEEAIEFFAELIVELSLLGLGIVGIAWYINNLFKDHHKKDYERISNIQERIDVIKQKHIEFNNIPKS